MKKACFIALFALIAVFLTSCVSVSPVVEAPAPVTPSAGSADISTPAAVTPMPSVTPSEPVIDESSTVHMLLINTGKSDALLFVLPNGKSFMVDTGLKDTYDKVDAALAYMGVNQLDAVFITHAHSDHIGGLKKLMKNNFVAAIYTNPLDTSTFSDKERQKLEVYSIDYGTVIKEARCGDTFDIGGVKIDVLSPDRAYSGEEDDNNNSLVLRVTYKDVRYLLMGDATYLIEQNLLNQEVDLTADVLKLGRHGKLDASLPDFLAAVSPEYAAVTGNTIDDSESPSPAVLARLDALGVQYFTNNGAQSAVDFQTDGKSCVAVVLNF